MFKNGPKEFKDLVVPSIFCSWFGLIQVQRKVDCLLNRPLTDDEKIKFADVCKEDFKPENFGIWEGRVVCLDYS